jgi:hypothetical protein
LLDTELTAMAGESYQRAYGAMVSLQMLAELEEVVLYKLVPEKRSSIRKMWWDRLQVRNVFCIEIVLHKKFVGMSTSCRGLAENHPGAFVGGDSPRRCLHLAEIRFAL